jgi:hypothetical protein
MRTHRFGHRVYLTVTLASASVGALFACTTDDLDGAPAFDVEDDDAAASARDARPDTSPLVRDSAPAPGPEASTPRPQKLTCGTTECDTLITDSFTFRACCPRANPTRCGYILPSIGTCVERDQPGVVDPECPRFVIPQRNRDGGTADVNVDANPDYYSLPGCCKPSGQCGYLDMSGGKSFSGGGFGCVRHEEFGTPTNPEPYPCVYREDAGADAHPDVADAAQAND